MESAPRIALFILSLLPLSTPLPAQETTAPPTVEQLAAMERVRPLVDAIWQDVRNPEKRDISLPYDFWTVTGRLIALGPDVVPFLVSEMELMDAATFHFCAYAIGQVGGPDAEAALRKAVRAADAREGSFGRACKRYALFGLALCGAPVSLDLMQTGLSTLGTRMVPDLPLASHLAILVGPAARPTVEKQLEAYRLDPAMTENLQQTLLALARVGDASLLPKVKPLLANPSAEVRALAADAISRLGQPGDCELLLAPLASAVDGERRYAADALERWKPEPCYTAMVERLAVERDIAVRGSLYNAIAAMRGEASLDVFRAYLESGDQFDRAHVISAIGQIGSPKGLNLLRSLLASDDVSAVVQSLQAMGDIGGESAVDTLMAMTGDPRNIVPPAALEVLVTMGVERVAPRVASALLGLVREPVGNFSLRIRIAEWGDALVKFNYTEPIEDLKAAAAVQSFKEIKASLQSCVRRLQLLKTNGDDVAAWTTASASPFLDVRQLADRRLAQIGSRAAIRALKMRLQKSSLSPEERADILLAIGEARVQGAAELVELHLSDSTYDTAAYHEARAAAAWTARRLGGDRMVRALQTSAERRDGRDWETLVYLAVLQKAAALPTLNTLRVRRLRYPQTPFGHQEAQLDGIISDLTAGRDAKAFDAPPADSHAH